MNRTPGRLAHVGEKLLERSDARGPGEAKVAAQMHGERHEAAFAVKRIELFAPDLHDARMRVARRERQRIIQRLHRGNLGDSRISFQGEHIRMVIVLEGRVIRESPLCKEVQRARRELDSARENSFGASPAMAERVSRASSSESRSRSLRSGSDVRSAPRAAISWPASRSARMASGCRRTSLAAANTVAWMRRRSSMASRRGRPARNP